MPDSLAQLAAIRSFPSLVKYLRDVLGWPIESDDVEDLTFEYEPEELGLDQQTAVKIREIKQLRPLADNQPWGIFYVDFEPKRLPVVALRRILRSLVVKKRASANRAQQRAWRQNDLLFVSSYGEADGREITLAHFSENSELGDLPTLKVLGWNTGNTILRLEDTHKVLEEKLRWPEDEADAEAWRKAWSSAFKLQYRETVRTSKDLAVRLARLAENIRGRANEVLSVESERGELRKLYKAFQEALIHDLGEDDFSDMYAQTIAYGLLSASISRQSGALVADNLSDMVPNTNPFLKELMQTFLTVGGRKGKIDFDELGINEVVELLRHTQMDEVLKDFGARNPQEDPVIHFYELFLKEYDPEKRMKRGVFYTPRPVVHFIVRSVDEILRAEFGLEDGLADTTTWGEMRERHEGLTVPPGVRADEPFVQILDPATGTGTFLVEVIDLIFGTMRAKWKREGKSERELSELWNDYVPRHLLPRLHGFELMMSPYAIAHMKIGLKLTETKYRFLSSERARIYLTNTLEEPKDFSSYFEQMAPALAHEAQAVNKVKRSTPINVILGNPPYSVSAGGGTPFINELMKEYTEGLGVENERKKGALQDEYLRFIRYCEWRIRTTGAGVVGMITNNSYLDGTLHRAMRRSLISGFEKVGIINLHGSGRAGNNDEGVDQNVFDILQGVSIIHLVKRAGPDDGQTPGEVRYVSVTGARKEKYERLLNNLVSPDVIHPGEPFYLLRPIDRMAFDAYRRFPSVQEVFGISSSGIETEKDRFAVDFEAEGLRRRLGEFADESVTDKEAASRFQLTDTPNWKVEDARRALRKGGINNSLFIKYLFHAFDWRYTYYSEDIITRPRRAVMQHMLLPNISLICLRQIKGEEFSHVLATRHVSNKFTLSSKSSNVSYQFPLYVYAAQDGRQRALAGQERRANISQAFYDTVRRKLGLHGAEYKSGFELTESDILHYIYSVTHSPGYRGLYSEYLKLDFLRVPLTSDAELFRKLCALGADLVALHLLEDDYEAASWNVSRPKGAGPLKTPVTRFAGRGGAEVAKGHPKYKDGHVYINPSSYFEGVPPEVWNFHVGGYQVCEKWLKDRRGRTLSDEDLTHYQRVAAALRETIRLMAEIDRTIEEHGGWPLTGSQETPPQPAAPGGLPFA